MRRRLLIAALMLALPLPALAAAPARAPAAPVAAAASLRYALDEAAAAFAKAGGGQVRLTYAASGSLVQQIEAGGPWQLFLSADEAHVLRLAKGGFAPTPGHVYAVGRLALVAPPGSSLGVDPQLKGLGRALKAGQVRRLAIANPEVAPYGARAQEALEHAGLWKLAEPRLVRGENVGQAFQFVATGGADAGLVSLSLVQSPGFRGRHALVPAGWHRPLNQRMALLKGAGPVARAFHDWLLSPAGQAVLARHGYGPPPATPAPRGGRG